MTGADLKRLMEEAPVSNHGRRKNSLLPQAKSSHDGQVWPAETSDLSDESAVARDFIRSETGGRDQTFSINRAGEHGLVAHRGLLTEDEVEYLDTEETKSMLEEYLGLEAGTLDRVYGGGGSITGASLVERAEVDEKILQAVESGKSTHWLSMAMGWGIRKRAGKSDGCPRMSRVLNRAMAARLLGEE